MLKLSKELIPFYASILISAVFSVVSTYLIIYFLQEGITYMQVSILISLSAFTSVLFDVPTGAIADVLGRKYSVIVSYVATALFLALIPLSSNFMYLAAIMFLWGITDTLSTGSYGAWVVDNVKSKKKVQQYYTYSATFGNIGTVTAPLIAAFIVKKSTMSLLFYVHATTIAISALVLLFFAKEKYKPKVKKQKSLTKQSFKQAKKTLKYVVKEKQLLYLFLALFFAAFSFSSIEIGWQPYLQAFDIPLEYIGYTLSIAGILSIFIPILTTKIAEKYTKKQIYLAHLSAVFFVLMLIAAIIQNGYLGMLLIIVIYMSMMFFMPIEQPFFQSLVPSKIRATAGSIKSTLIQLSAGIAILLSGGIMQVIGVKYLYPIMGVFLLPAIYFYLKIDKNKV